MASACGELSARACEAIIEAAAESGDCSGLESLLEMLQSLDRGGKGRAHLLCRRVERALARIAEDRRRYEERWAYERRCWQQGFRVVCGVDEAGRGPLAGPVVAGAAVLEPGTYIQGLDDSKKLTPAQRERIYDLVVARADAVSTGIATVEEIDTHNIYRATIIAMVRALKGLSIAPDYVITDAVRLPGLPTPQLPVIDGDALCNCVAAASILAKVTRDRIMVDIDREFPEYGFCRHKGYATSEHLQALERLGPCPHHRTTFHWRSEQGTLPGLDSVPGRGTGEGAGFD
ncbi:MAG: ribonuclease HII [Firmicutes bacterium]|nr:ribonuclease HII [Bacillota bacterium]